MFFLNGLYLSFIFFLCLFYPFRVSVLDALFISSIIPSLVFFLKCVLFRVDIGGRARRLLLRGLDG